jgi:hypothetical protein
MLSDTLIRHLRFKDFFASKGKEASVLASEWLETIHDVLPLETKLEKLPDGAARVWYVDGRKLNRDSSGEALPN